MPQPCHTFCFGVFGAIGSLAWWRTPVTTEGICMVSCLPYAVHNLEQHSCDTGNSYCSRVGTHWRVWEVAGEQAPIWREELPAPRGMEVSAPHPSGSTEPLLVSHRGYVLVLTSEQKQPIHSPNCPPCLLPNPAVLESWFFLTHGSLGDIKALFLLRVLGHPLQILSLQSYIRVARLSLHTYLWWQSLVVFTLEGSVR